MIVRIDDPGDARLAPYARVADPRALLSAGLFAVEGRLVVPRLLASRYRTHSVLVSETALEPLGPLVQARPDVDVYVTSPGLMTALGGVDFHRGCLALAHRGDPLPLEAAIGSAGGETHHGAPVVVLEGINNPDNVGGIFRSAHAFDARAVVLGPNCGDPLYRKAIRTSMGTVLDVSWAEAGDWPAALDVIGSRGYAIVAMTTDAQAPTLRKAVADLDRPAALLFGSEGYGLSAGALAAAEVRARIPMPNPGADSLNVAAAASIALYETRRG